MKYRIKQIRESQNITQKQLEKSSGVSRAIISYLESESKAISTTKISTLEKIAEAMDVKVSDLLDED